MIDDFRNDIHQVSDIENNSLSTSFTEKEVKEAIFQMERNKAPGLDVFPAEFYQVFWEVIKNDMVAMFHDFHSCSLPLFGLNFGISTLLLKKADAKQIQQYRHICLLNVNLKVFTKVAANRISNVAQKVVRSSQSTFMQGRFILDGIVILHETIHELHKEKLDGIVLKVDFEKAYDKVKLPFLLQTLRMKGFSAKWCS